MPSPDNRDAALILLGVEDKKLLSSIFNKHLSQWKKDNPDIDEKFVYDDEDVSLFSFCDISAAALILLVCLCLF